MHHYIPFFLEYPKYDLMDLSGFVMPLHPKLVKFCSCRNFTEQYKHSVQFLI